MAISRSFCTALVFLSFALFFVCVADEANKKDDKSNTKTIRGNDVKTRILGRSGKILIARSEKDDNDEGKGKGKKDRDVEDMKDNSGDDVDGKDSVDRKDPDSKGDRDDADDIDDKDDDDFKDDNEDLLSFQLDEIKEKDSDDNDVDDKHSVDSFDDVNFKFSQVRTNFRFQGIPAINVNLSANLDDPNAKLDIMVFLFLQTGTITFGNETFAVQTGTVKFNIKISDWDFCGDSSSLSCSQGRAGEYLDLKLKIKSKGSPAEVDDDDRKKANKKPVCDDKDDDKDDRNDNDDDDDDDDDCPIIYNMGGDSEMLLNKGVMTDDNDYTAMPAGFPKIEYDDGETKFVFRIPKFRNNVVLDPSVTPGEKPRPANAASWLQINVTFALLLQLAAMFAAHY